MAVMKVAKTVDVVLAEVEGINEVEEEAEVEEENEVEDADVRRLQLLMLV